MNIKKYYGGAIINRFFRKEGKAYLIALQTLPEGGVCVQLAHRWRCAMSNSIWSLKGLFASPRYEIGDIYLTTRIGNPNGLLGYGTWELIPGRTLVCVDTSDSDFSTVKKTGGEKKHTLTVSEMPNHTHEVKSGDGANAKFMGYAPETNTTGGATLLC